VVENIVEDTEKKMKKENTLNDNIKNFSTGFIFIGAVVFIVALFFGLKERAWHAYLLSYFYFILPSLGALFFCQCSVCY